MYYIIIGNGSFGLLSNTCWFCSNYGPVWKSSSGKQAPFFDDSARIDFQNMIEQPLTCRSSRWALAGVLYSIRPYVCRSNGRLQGPARTNVFSSLSSDHNTDHKHWTGRDTQRWGGRGRDYHCAALPHKGTLRSTLSNSPVCSSKALHNYLYCTWTYCIQVQKQQAISKA